MYLRRSTRSGSPLNSLNESSVSEMLVVYGYRLIRLFRNHRTPDLAGYMFKIISQNERLKIHRTLKKSFTPNEIERDKRTWESLEEYLQTSDSISCYINEFYRSLIRVKPTTHILFLNEFEKVFAKKLETHSRNVRQSALKSRLAVLKKSFALTDKEVEVLMFFYVLSVNEAANEIFTSNLLQMDTVMRSVKVYCRFFGMTSQELRDVFRKDSALVRSNLIQRDRRYSNKIELSQHVGHFLSGLGENDLSNEYLEADQRAAELSLNDFVIPHENIEVMREMLLSNKGSNLLLMGVPGTGKTELARTLVKSLGFETMLLRQTDAEGNEDLNHRKTGLAAAQNLLKERKCVLIVDECDPLVNTYGGLFACDRNDKDSKSWINHYLERSELKTIWITNNVEGIDESTRRRFSYVQEFKRPVQRQRLKAWTIQATKQRADFLDDDTLEKFAAEYTVSPGTIELALRDVQAMGAHIDKEQKLSRLRNILNQQQLFTVGRRKLTDINSKYSLAGLNTDLRPESVLNTVQNFYKHLQGGASDIRNLNLLLMGPPGTGKTEFVKYLSKQTDRELLVKRSSDLISAYVGESEKNIANAFSEAEQQGAILFIDEADSLFINRAEANRSWEVSQTNKLLCQMENFNGTLACATNFNEHMDPAVMRRFTFKMKFNYLKPEANLSFFQKTLCSLLDRSLAEDEVEMIKRIRDLSPGDFKVVYQKFFFERSVSAMTLINALKEETLHRRTFRRTIGLIE